MSTHDVPGAVAANKDDLHSGCWAEHEDGSLILVLSTEDDNVYYDLFDMSRDPVLTYRDAMPIGDFQLEFSYNIDKLPPSVKKRAKKTADKYVIDIWTWHDKTPFPMSRVVNAGFKGGVQLPAAPALRTAADRISDALKLRAKKLDPSAFAHMADVTHSRVGNAATVVMSKISRAFKELRK